MAEKISKVRLEHILKADPFTQKYSIVNNTSTRRSRKLVESNEDFFNFICVKEKKSIIANGQRIINVDDWVENNIYSSNNCLLLIIEGYAGCGKSTWVQSILYELYKNYSYEYSYYNYNVGVHHGTNSNVNPIKESIMNEFVDQMKSVLATTNGEKIFEKFKDLTNHKKLKDLEINKGIWSTFSGTESINTSVSRIINSKNAYEKEVALKDFSDSVFEQLNDEAFNTYRMLCLDYLWRLAQFLSYPQKYRNNLYVCYDNLDAIYDNEILSDFRYNLLHFRFNLSEFIDNLNDDIDEFGEVLVPPFIIFTTYRKITEIRSDKNIEMIDDMYKNPKYVKNIEVSNLYNYNEIVKKRTSHFLLKINNDSLFGENTQLLKKQMKDINKLLSLNFFSKKYAELCNHNYRSCSNILNIIVNDYNEEFQKCLMLLKDNNDGYNDKKSCYYGASSVFLHLVCKILKKEHIWDSQCLDLTNHTDAKGSKHDTSLSRLILTYLCNNETNSVSICDIFEKFEKIFDYDYICKIVGQMLTRITDEIWRRPLYYSKNALVNESKILDKLMEQYNDYNNGKFTELVEFCICESGCTFVEKIVPHFEFYSTRLASNSEPLYCINDVEVLKNNLCTVYNQIKICCDKQESFKNNYISKYNIAKEKYLELPFHPKTHQGNSQLHIERVIFSHIAYLNEYRKYLFKNMVAVMESFNDVLLEYIGKYLELYFLKIHPISKQRETIAQIMQNKTNSALNGKGDERYISIDVDE